MELASNRTLIDVQRGYRLHFECNNIPYCYYSKNMSVERLIEWLGEDFISTEFYGVLRCREQVEEKSV